MDQVLELAMDWPDGAPRFAEPEELDGLGGAEEFSTPSADDQISDKDQGEEARMGSIEHPGED